MDFGFMTIVHDQSLSTESSKSEIGRGTTPFMAPELLFPSKFGLDKWIPTKEADIYAMATVIYQVLTVQWLAHARIDSVCAGAHWDDTIW